MRKVLSWVLVLALVLGSFSMAFAATTTYTDVAGTASEEAVTVLSDLGVVNGYEDGTFRPGNTVSYQEWATILVRALGYTDDSLQGTWPANYVSKAQGLGVFDSVTKSAGGANRGDVAIMLYNTIDLKIGTVNKDDEWVANTGKTVTIDGDKVDLGDRMIFKLGADEYDQKVINGDEDASINLAQYIGAYATVYSKDSKVIAVADIKSTFIDGKAKGSTFEGDDDVDYSGFDVTKDTVYFINGKTVGEDDFLKQCTDGTLDGTDVTVSGKVSGKTLKDVYAVMIWSAQAAEQVDKDDLADIKDDQKLLGYDLPTLRSGEIDTTKVDVLGVSSIDKIAEDNVVAVYTAKGTSKGEITRVEVGTEVVKGEVTKVTTGSTPKYTINGTQYKMSKLDGVDSAPELGDTVEAYLDYDGKMYKLDTSEDTSDYAFTLSKAIIVDDGINDSKIKLLTADGSETTFVIKSSYATGEDFNNDFEIAADEENSLVNTIVKYTTNKSGQITKLEAVDSSFTGAKLSKNRDVLDGKEVSSNAVVFSPKSSSEWKVVSLSSVKTGESMDGRYATKSNGDIVAIKVDSSSSVGDSDNYGLISNYAKTKSDEDDVFEVTAVINGKKVTYLTDDDRLGDKLKEKTVLYQIELDGEVITDLTETTNTETDPDKINGTNVIYMNDTPEKDLGVDVTDKFGVAKYAYAVTKTNGSKIEVNGDMVSIGDANIYTPSFDKDDAFDSWTTASSVAKGGYVILVQTDDDSSTWDTVIYFKSGDLEKEFVTNILGNVSK